MVRVRAERAAGKAAVERAAVVADAQEARGDVCRVIGLLVGDAGIERERCARRVDVAIRDIRIVCRANCACCGIYLVGALVVNLRFELQP